VDEIMFVAHIQHSNYTKLITCQSLDPDKFLCS